MARHIRNRRQPSLPGFPEVRPWRPGRPGVRRNLEDVFPASELHHCYRYDAFTGRIRPIDPRRKFAFEHARNPSNPPSSSTYRIIWLNGTHVDEHHIVFALHHGRWPRLHEGLEIDHINRNPLDNRIENLREVTTSQNAFNRHYHRKEA